MRLLERCIGPEAGGADIAEGGCAERERQRVCVECVWSAGVGVQGRERDAEGKWGSADAPKVVKKREAVAVKRVRTRAL